MSTISDVSGRNPAKLIHKLTCKLTGKEGDDVLPDYKLVMQLAQGDITESDHNEHQLVEDIKKSLLKAKREKDATRFNYLYRKLLSNTILKNRSAILCFLYCLKDSNTQASTRKGQITVKHLSEISVKSTRMPVLSIDKGIWANECSKPNIEHNYEALRTFWQGSSRSNINNKSSSKAQQEHRNSRSFPENVIIRELLYAFQAINGQIIRFDCDKETVWIEPKSNIPEPMREQILKLAELGWLYNKINKYYASTSAKRSGLVEQSFAAALHNELVEYYRLLAVLESQLQQEDEQSISSTTSGVTLHSLSYWAYDPFHRFKILASLVDSCKGLKGGALASVIYSYLIHGDLTVRNLVNTIWGVVSVPIFKFLKRWIIDGELEDIFEEFFVAANTNVTSENWWDQKYYLRESMVPSFINVDQAYKILSTGKSINFLKHICMDKIPLHENSTISRIIARTCAETVFSQDEDGGLQTIIDVIYKETSSHLLNIMHATYKFMDHLKAMRRYLLLGQGDFIRHLMDLLEPHLNKPANTLYMQNLSGILDTAIRSTNAQFDDPEILKRLDNRLMEISAGDCGWDIYTLDYKIDGPIATVFTPKIMKLYLQLFHYLWKGKRMEYSLSEMWLSQFAYSRNFKLIPELSSIMHQCHILTSEMVHFVQQMQYYITFEVMECSWDVLETKVKAAEDLDKVIIAHEEFLEMIISRVLLDDSSEDLQLQLQTIYNLIIQFKIIQDQFFETANDEINLRQSITEEIKCELNSDIHEKKVEDEKSRQTDFVCKKVNPIKSQLRILSVTYQDMVKKFLLMLTNHTDVNLQFLSFRLDFNNHYKNQDTRLHTSLTFQKRRQSAKFLFSN